MEVNMSKESMLVVEDEEIMREALVDYFSGEGHRVDTAGDGDSALKNVNFIILVLRVFWKASQ
jgi:CheY-like chemotaxis protein